MSMEKWSPIRELENMRREMDRIWDEMSPAIRRPLEAPWRRIAGEKDVATPAVDIIDKAREVVVNADMPGVGKDDVNISLREDTLTITGAVAAEPETPEENYYYSERNYKSFSRSITIPFKLNPDKIRASLKDGVLTIRLTKAEEVQPRKIKVEVE